MPSSDSTSHDGAVVPGVAAGDTSTFAVPVVVVPEPSQGIVLGFGSLTVACMLLRMRKRDLIAG